MVMILIVSGIVGYLIDDDDVDVDDDDGDDDFEGVWYSWV